MVFIILVLAVIGGAFAAPQIQSIQPAKGLRNSGPLLQRANYAVLDGGDITVLTLTAETVLKDLSVIPEGQNMALGSGIAVLGDLAVGRTGDACVASNYINKYVEFVTNGSGGLGNSLIYYIDSLNNNIDNIVNAVTNPQRARYSSGARTGCPADGREYKFEEAWDSILGAAKPTQLSLLQEEYCSARRLYCSFTARNNNVAAQLTAASLPPSVKVFDKVGGVLFELIQALATGANPAGPAAQAKQALANAARVVTVEW